TDSGGDIDPPVKLDFSSPCYDADGDPCTCETKGCCPNNGPGSPGPTAPPCAKYDFNEFDFTTPGANADYVSEIEDGTLEVFIDPGTGYASSDSIFVNGTASYTIHPCEQGASHCLFYLADLRFTA